MKKIIGGLVRKTLVFALALNVSAAITACSSGGSDIETFAPAESRTFQFESEDMPKIKDDPTVAPLEETDEETTMAETTENADAETTPEETTTAPAVDSDIYADGVYKVTVFKDAFYEEDGKLCVKAGRLENVYLENEVVEALEIGSVISLSQYGLEDFFIEYNIEYYDDWIELDYTYYLEPTNDGSGRWLILEVNDLPVNYVAETMNVTFDEHPYVVEYTTTESNTLEDPREFFELYDYLEQWPVTMEIRNNRVVSFEYEYRP